MAPWRILKSSEVKIANEQNRIILRLKGHKDV